MTELRDMNRVATFLIVAALILPASLSEQGASQTPVPAGTVISGVVHDASGRVVVGASVTITGGKLRAAKTVVSDASGAYSSGWIAIGSYTVAVTAPGTIGASAAATVNTGLVTPLDITLE